MPCQNLVTEPTVRKTGSVVPDLPTCRVSLSNGKNCSQSTLAFAVWVTTGSEKQLIFKTDNSTNVAIWYAQSSKSKDLMDLVRKIFLISAIHNFPVKFQHIPWSNNPTDDALSRLQMQTFRELAPGSKPNPTPISEHLFQL